MVLQVVQYVLFEKFMYGIQEASRTWYEILSKGLKGIGNYAEKVLTCVMVDEFSTKTIQKNEIMRALKKAQSGYHGEEA